MFVTSASAPNSPPSASEPVSPMKMRAGAAFHHRNPVAAPIIAAATIAASCRSTPFTDVAAAAHPARAAHVWRNCQKEMNT